MRHSTITNETLAEFIIELSPKLDTFSAGLPLADNCSSPLNSDACSSSLNSDIRMVILSPYRIFPVLQISKYVSVDVLGTSQIWVFWIFRTRWLIFVLPTITRTKTGLIGSLQRYHPFRLANFVKITCILINLETHSVFSLSAEIYYFGCDTLNSYLTIKVNRKTYKWKTMQQNLNQRCSSKISRNLRIGEQETNKNHI